MVNQFREEKKINSNFIKKKKKKKIVKFMENL